MNGKPVIRRAVADNDIDDAIRYYDNHSIQTAFGFIDELQRSYQRISAQPPIGSPRHGYELALPGLLSRKLDKYPYIVFYYDHNDHIDVWRILHEKRDIPSNLD